METTLTAGDAKAFEQGMKAIEALGGFAVRHNYYLVALDFLKLIVLAAALFMLWRFWQWLKVYQLKLDIPEELTLDQNHLAKILSIIVAIVCGLLLMFVLQDMIARIINPQYMAFSDLLGLFTGR